MKFTYSQYSNGCESYYRIAAKHSQNHYRNSGMRMTMSTASTMTPRIHRKTLRIPSKRHPGKVLPGKLHSMSRMGPGKITPGKRINPRPHPPPCDNSNDSGLGFDQHVEVQNSQQTMRSVATARSIPLDDENRSGDESEDMGSDSSSERFKRRKIQSIQIDTDDACSNDAFIQKIATTSLEDIRITATATNTTSSISSPAKYAMGRSAIRPGVKRQLTAVQNNISTSSKDGSVHLEIVSQPEQQHRARYQTEGSRGAVKDRSGNGFPVVKLTGYNKPAILQVFIGTDIGRVAPHMFYQACKVAGKNSTPCNEKKVDGTMVIEIEFKPDSDMTITCDCVGILKERNVDVEHRFPDQSAQRSKKKSTRCRMVFRTQLARDDGSVETLQVCSLPIICTQPPGVPEVSKKSLNSCPVEGGLELFIIGKNFLKDTCVIFQDATEGSPTLGWEERVTPDKEFLQQTHLVCTVPPYINHNITKPINVYLYVMSSGKRSESHNFFYTPKGVHSPLAAATTISTLHGTLQNQDVRFTEDATNQSNRSLLWSTDVLVEPKHEIDSGMMPPPATLPLGVRRQSSSGNIISEQIAQLRLKTEMIEENSQSSVPDAAMQQDSLDQFPSANDTTVDQNPMQQYQRIRKSIDMLDMESMSTIINESNSLQNFPTHETPMSVVVKQEQMAAQIQAAEMLSAGQNSQSVSKFLALESSLSKIKSQVDAPTAAAVNSMFVNSTNNNASVMFPPQHLSEMTNMTTTVSTETMEQTYNGTIITNSHPTTSNTLNQILNMQQNSSSNSVSSNSSSSTLDQLLNMQQNSSTNSSSPSNTLNQILNMQQNPSPNSVASSPSSNSSPLHGVHSPITQDIILNSQPAASINSVNMQLISPNSNTPTEHITTDIILNTTISPSMMCGTADQSNLMANPVTIANTMLADINMHPPPPPQQNILSNMMMNTSPEQIHVSHRTSPVAVKNMILKATTDFINNQENNLNTDQSTINALMSLNTGSGVLTGAQSQMLNMSTPTQTTSNSNVLTGTEQQQHQQQQQQAMDICQSQTSLTQHLPMFGNTQTMANHRLMEGQGLTSNNATNMSNVPLQNILMTHEVTRNASNEFMHDITKAETLSSNISSQSNQESLLQAVSLVRSELEKPKMNGVEQIALPQQNNMVQRGTTQPPTTTATIPQEITTMSDQDLISYINPSCFDQV